MRGRRSRRTPAQLIEVGARAALHTLRGLASETSLDAFLVERDAIGEVSDFVDEALRLPLCYSATAAVGGVPVRDLAVASSAALAALLRATFPRDAEGPGVAEHLEAAAWPLVMIASALHSWVMWLQLRRDAGGGPEALGQQASSPASARRLIRDSVARAQGAAVRTACRRALGCTHGCCLLAARQPFARHPA